MSVIQVFNCHLYDTQVRKDGRRVPTAASAAFPNALLTLAAAAARRGSGAAMDGSLILAAAAHPAAGPGSIAAPPFPETLVAAPGPQSIARASAGGVPTANGASDSGRKHPGMGRHDSPIALPIQLRNHDVLQISKWTARPTLAEEVRMPPRRLPQPSSCSNLSRRLLCGIVLPQRSLSRGR
jgi:hypothetical protein